MFFAAGEMGEVGKAKAALVLFEARKIDKAVKYLSWQLGPRFDFLFSLRPVLQGGAYFHNLDKRKDQIIASDLLASLFGTRPFISKAKSFDLALARETGLDSFFDLDNIRRLYKSLEEDANLKLSEDEKKGFVNVLDIFPFDKINNLKVDDFFEFVEKLSFIAKKLEIPDLENFALNRSPYHYFASKIYVALKSGDFSEAIEFFKRWPYAQDILISVLKDEASNFTSEKIRDTKLRSFYEAIGHSALLGGVV